MDDIAQQLLVDLQSNVENITDSLLTKRLNISKSIEFTTQLLSNEKETVRDIGMIYGQFSEKLMNISDIEENRYEQSLEERANALEMIDLAEQKTQLLEKQTELQDILKNQAAELSDEQLSNISNQINAIDTMVDDIQKAGASINEYAGYLRESTDMANAQAEAFAGMFDKLQQFVEFLPGGQFITQQLGLDQVREQFVNKVSNVIVDGFARGQVSVGALRDASMVAFSQIGTAIRTAFSMLLANPMLLAIGAIAGALAVTVSRFNEIDEAQQKFQRELGLSTEQASELRGRIGDISADMARLGLETETVYDITRLLGESYGGVRNLSEQLIRDTSMLAASLGLGAEEAVNVTRQFDIMASASDMTSTELLAGATHLAQMSGVAPADVLQDMAETSGTVAKFIGQNPEALAQAAVKARQLGVNLETVAGIAENLLDWQSSIDAQMEASVLAGRQINLNEARRLAFANDLAGMQEEILDQVGSIAEFNQMNAIARQSIADAVGVSVGELQKMIKNQENMNKLQKDQLSTVQAFQEGLSMSDVLDPEGVLTPMNKLQASLKALTVQLGTLLAPVIEVTAVALSSLATIIETLFGWIPDLNAEFTKWDGTLATITKTILGAGGLYLGIKLLRAAFSGLGSSLGNVFGSMKNIFGGGGTGALGGIKNMFSTINPKNVAMFAAGAAMMAGSLYVLAKAFQEFQKIDWENWHTAILPALGGLVVLGGALLAFGTLAGSAAPLILAFAGAMLVVSSAVYVFAEAAETFASAYEIIFSGIGAVMDSIAGIIDSVGTSFQLISEGIERIVNLDGYLGAAGGILAISSAVSNLAGSMSELDEYRGLLNDMSDTVVTLDTVMTSPGAQNKAGTMTTENTGTAAGNMTVTQKLDELLTAFKQMQIAVYMDGKLITKNVAKHGDILVEALPKKVNA